MTVRTLKIVWTVLYVTTISAKSQKAKKEMRVTDLMTVNLDSGASLEYARCREDLATFVSLTHIACSVLIVLTTSALNQNNLEEKKEMTAKQMKTVRMALNAETMYAKSHLAKKVRCVTSSANAKMGYFVLTISAQCQEVQVKNAILKINAWKG